MPRHNDWCSPCCPICCASMKKNGKVKTQKKSIKGVLMTYIPKQNWRCSKCNYSETVDSIAHNANVRTGYGVEKRVNFALPKKIQPNKRQDNCPKHSGFRQPQILSYAKPS